MQNNYYSTIIIGSGISGLYAALKLSETDNKNRQILIVTKSKIYNCNSYYAQGGMVAVLNTNTHDSIESHISDTLNAGAGLSEFNTIKFISENSDKVVNDLLENGVDFDRDPNGNFTLTKEGAHSVNRILHAGGDATGREMEIALAGSVLKCKNIKILENTCVTDLIINDQNSCIGINTVNGNNETNTYYSAATIIATGGIGQLYKYTTNPSGATADGIALAYKAGADLQDMEFVQFHPTALAIDTTINRFLISEAVRGEGAILCDKNKTPFMQKYHEKKDLAPRDIVARAIYKEMEDNKVSNVFLNATIIGAEKLGKRFPTIKKVCAKYGIDITKDLIPVAPAAHYFMGGIKTNLNSETSIDGLYAIGEASSTGLHGANRLASNSLLECVVCAYFVAERIKNQDKNNNNDSKCNTKTEVKKCNPNKVVSLTSVKEKIKEVMWNGVGIARDEHSLTNAYKQINNIQKSYTNNGTIEGYEIDNMLLVCKLIIESALNRKESRGAHYRTDYLNTSDDIKHSLINKKGEYCLVK